MYLCLEMPKSGEVCFGDLMARMHGTEIGTGELGLALFAGVMIAVFGYVFSARSRL